MRELQLTKINTNLTNGNPAPLIPVWGRFPGRPAGSGGQPGAERRYNRRDTWGGGGTQEMTLVLWSMRTYGWGCSFKTHSPGGSIWQQDLQQELRVNLSHVDPPIGHVQHVADRLLLRVQRHDVGRVRAQVQVGVSTWRFVKSVGDSVGSICQGSKGVFSQTKELTWEKEGVAEHLLLPGVDTMEEVSLQIHQDVVPCIRKQQRHGSQTL